jgi:hypothetical protein
MRYLLLLLFLGCNPVKQVLRDQEKLEEVAKVVIAGGWCANDTTFITKSDTLIEVDTLTYIDTETYTQIVNDTTYITRWKSRDIKTTITIHDTLRSYIVDNAHIKLLQTDSARLSSEVIEWKGKARRRQLWVFGLIALIVGALYIKSKL